MVPDADLEMTAENVVFEQPQLIPEVVDVLAARPGIERVEMWLWQSAQTTLPKIIQADAAEKGPPAQMRGDRGGSVGGNSSGTGWRVGVSAGCYLTVADSDCIMWRCMVD